MATYNKKTIEDVEVSGKKVLVRCDFNVPQAKDGSITDPKRIVEALPTIKYLVSKGAKVILTSHLGRPWKKDENGKSVGPDTKYTLKPIADKLSELLGKKIIFAADLTVVGDNAKAAVAAAKNGDVILLENVRFRKEEEKNDPAFSKELASLCEVYVNDAFGTAHRAHSSTAGVAQVAPQIPAVAGYLIQKEITIMGGALAEPKRPFVAILGGSKVSDKIGVINNLIEKVDMLIIGGGMAYTFYRALERPVGTSLCENDKVDLAKGLIDKAHAKGISFIIPVDNVIAREFKEDTVYMTINSDVFPDGWMGMDIGEKTRELFAKSLIGAGTVVWNGPMGVTEWDKFAVGTEAVAKAVADSGAVSIIGGGDSAAAVEKLGYADKMTHISTGGGASLEFLEGLELPGIACLNNK